MNARGRPLVAPTNLFFMVGKTCFMEGTPSAVLLFYLRIPSAGHRTRIGYVGGRGLSRHAAEDRAKIFGVAKARPFGNLLQGEIVRFQHRNGFFDAKRGDIFLGRGAVFPLKKLSKIDLAHMAKRGQVRHGKRPVAIMRFHIFHRVTDQAYVLSLRIRGFFATDRAENAIQDGGADTITIGTVGLVNGKKLLKK